MLVIVGVGALVQHTGWAGATIGGMIVSWAWMARRFASDEVVHLGIGMASAVVLALVLRRVMQAVVRSLQAAWQEAADLAIQDELTGLLNRRGLAVVGEKAVTASRRLGLPLVVLYLDVDDLKAVNDRDGHEAGDAVLRDTATQLSTAFRDADVVARIGGDEFVILLVGVTPGDIDVVIDRVRRSGVSVSVGAAVADGATDLDHLLDQADRAMYADKAGRRGRAVPDAVGVRNGRTE
jgi:diguanylate cyclase (GGDEF)-like protein